MGLKRDKTNSLEDEIKNLDKSMEVVYGGGYYNLYNIREKPDTTVCMDI